MVTASAAIVSIVSAAFFASGALNAGTPFETASTPVIAVQPFENAVSRRNSVNGEPVGGRGSTDTTGVTVPATTCQTPRAIKPRIDATKKYVGTAKICPDSLMPLRFPSIS